MSGWGPAGDAFDVVLVGDAAGTMAEAVALAGGRVIGRSDWGEAMTPVAGALVALELSGQPVDGVADLAPLADIVVCDLEQLDAVAAELLWHDAQLLCDPSPADRIAALALAAALGSVPEAAVREGEGVRLRRFSAEVARIAATLARLAAEERPGEVADHGRRFDAGPGIATADADPALIRQVLRARRMRAGFFGEGLFDDPAWDMLLDLYAAELEGGRVSVSSLCIASHVAPTTALRWIGRMTEAGLFERRPDPQDRRRAFMALTAQASAAMRAYLAALARAGLALG